MRQLMDSCWDVEDVLAMCGDSEHAPIDDYAQSFVDDVRKRVIVWGMRMAFSERQELFLMTIADKGLREQQRKARYARPK